MGNTTPRAWQLVLALQARLQDIATANNYRTDIGSDVSIEATQWDDGAEHIGIFTAQITSAPQNNSTRRVRTLELSIEPSTPTTVGADGVTNAHQRMHDIIADVEDALVGPDAVSVNGALDIRVSEIHVVDEPNGFQVVAASIMVEVDFLP